MSPDLRAPRWLAAAAAVAAVAVVASACGGGDDEHEVRAAFGDLRTAYLEEDYGAVCARLSAQAKREVGRLGHLEPTSCPRDVAQNMSAAILSARDRAVPEIEAVAVDGDSATVDAVLGGGTPGSVRFVKEGGRWKLGQLFGTTAPPPPELR